MYVVPHGNAASLQHSSAKKLPEINYFIAKNTATLISDVSSLFKIGQT